MIDRSTIERVFEAARIEEVVGDFVTLRRSGVNLRGLCPFHDDRTPSFFVSPARNYCKCFACGEGGNPVGFIMKHEQLSYGEAIKYLARKYGIPVKEKEMSPEDVRRKDDRESMFILNEWAKDWMRRQLLETPEGRDVGLTYFRGRGFRDDILERFQVGYCPKGRGHSLWDAALKAGFQEMYITNKQDTTELSQSIGTGLATKYERDVMRDRFEGRVVWPIFTISGKVAGFGGRVLDAATKGVSMKYVNSPESLVYSKRRELYGLYQAKQAISKQDLCYLVEGYTDVMAMHQSGVENVVASSGTALTEDQIRLIHRLTDNICVVYDGDAAGIKASQRGIDMLLRQGMNVRLLLLPDGEDPDSFARGRDAKEFKDYISLHQTDFIKFKTSLLLDEAKGDPVAMSRLVNNIVQSIAVIPDEIARTLYIRETAQTMSLREELIDKAVGQQMAKNREEWLRQKQREEERNAAAAPKVGDDKPAESDAEAPRNVPEAPKNPAPADRLLPIERELVRAVVRYGTVIVGERMTEAGERETLSVIDYINLALQQDNMPLRDPLLRTMLEEALRHKNDEGFESESFFLNHPDADISRMAFQLASEKEQLSRLYADGKERSGQDVALALVPHLLTDYKIAIVKERLQALTEKLRSPALAGDKEAYARLLADFMQLKAVEKKLSLSAGDRVIN
ncbi:MAG: DNA primase [Prevotellaceae bacterium]|nr:DNA primase [Prevotellaceae bacterium]